MAAVALPWFVLITTGSLARMGIVMAAEFTGMALLGIPSGRVATGLGPRRMMLTADTVRAPLVALIPVLHWTGLLSFPVVVAIAFAVGAFFPAYSSSQQLLLAAITGSDELGLTRVVGVLSSVNETASFVGPALGGFLVAVLGPAGALLVDAGSYLVAVAIVWGLVPSVPAERDTRGGRVAEGVRFVRRDRALVRVLVGVAIVEIGFTALLATLPVATIRRFGATARLAGWLLAAYGAGSVAGGLISARARSAGGRTGPLALAGGAAASASLLAPLPAWGVGLVVAAIGVSAGLFFPRFFAATTLRAPERLRARVTATTHTVISATGPLGFVAAGVLLQRAASPFPGFAIVAGAFGTGAAIVASSGFWPSARRSPPDGGDVGGDGPSS